MKDAESNGWPASTRARCGLSFVLLTTLRIAMGLLLVGLPLMTEFANGAEASPGVAAGGNQAGAAQQKVPLANGDTVVVGVGGSNGYSLLAPSPSGGWTTVAELNVAGMDAASWTGYDCVTGSGNTVAVTFAPSIFANYPDLRDHGAFAAMVNLSTHTISVLPKRVSLQYHTPGCGVGDTATFTSNPGTNESTTEVTTVNGDGKIQSDFTVPSQVTSAVPQGNQVVGVEYNHVASFTANGTASTLAVAPGVAYDLHPTAGGGVDYLTTKAGTQTAEAFHIASGSGPTEVGTGPLHNLSVDGGGGGHNLVVGQLNSEAGVNDGPKLISSTDQPQAVSLDGSTVVSAITPAPTNSSSVSSSQPTVPFDHLRIDAAGPSGTATNTVDLNDGPVGSHVLSSGLTTDAPSAAPQVNVSTPKCVIGRNDPNFQVMQPDGAQVEWAADLAVTGQLKVSRPANYNNLGLGAYKPSTLFPLPGLDGGGTIPAQVLLGILAQESNLSQASPHALPGVPGNPNIADYYGTVYEVNSSGFQLIVDSDYDNADCGYGLGQVTAGMYAADSTSACGAAYTPTQQAAIAGDFAANVAAAAQILECTWNTTYTQGDTANTGASSGIENWYDAIWAYNTGVHQLGDPGIPAGLYGLGWTNNPADDSYPPYRELYLSTTYADAANPGNWPYQEKVLGWADHSQLDPHGNPTYAPAPLLNLSTNYYLWCTTANDCSSDQPGVGYCMNTNRYYCLWHGNVTWAANVTSEVVTYAKGSAEPTVADPYPPSCTATVDGGDPVDGNAPGTGAQMVTDVANTSENLVGCGASPSAGTFTMTTGAAADGAPTGQIDLHQLGVGYGGHIWFAHTVDGAARPWMVDTGTWTAPTTATGWQRIWVHIPDNGADTYQAEYHIVLGTGDTTGHYRVVNQRWNANTWVDLGAFNLSAGAKVWLSNSTYSDGTNGDVDIAWDAVAFAPTSKPTVSYVALGDSYSSGEGLAPYYANSDISAYDNGDDPTDSCHRSSQGWPLGVYSSLVSAHPGSTEFHFLACSGATIDDVYQEDDDDGTLPTDKGEVPQMEEGWLDENTTNVTVGISGNDARFADILKGCMIATVSAMDCVDSNYYLGSDPQPLTTEEPIVINSQESRLTELIGQIHVLAPNASIVLMGYPYIIASPSDFNPLDLSCVAISTQDDIWFEQEDDLLDGVMRSAVSGLSYVAYTDPKQQFLHHEACTDAAPEWINSVLGLSDTGSGPSLPGSGSFHPKVAGMPSYASQAVSAFPTATK